MAKAAVQPTTVPAAAVGSGGGNFWGVIREAFAGAWQRNIEVDATEGLLAFSAVYACLDLISKDISKLRPKLMQLKGNVWIETNSAAFDPVLRKPNNYQTRIQFLSNWVLCKLIHGNAYILKQRDNRGVVVALHVLNARMVRAAVTEFGDVFYNVSYDRLAQTQSVQVPASEIIHDRGACLFHPLIGVPPIYACAMSASQGNRIQNNSAKFFENMSRPGGVLTAPGTIADETADRLKAEFEANFSGANLGRLLVAGDGIEYEPMTIPAQQAQLIEQLQWTVQDVARCFHVPLHKIASDTGIKYANMAEMNQDYYSQCLQSLIEEIEILLDEGLGLAGDGPQAMGVELDLEVLMRMDPLQRATRNETAIKAGYMKPNEARALEGWLPVEGGDTPYLQQQNFSLAELAKQKLPSQTPPPPAPAPAAVKPDDGSAAAAQAAADAIEAAKKTAEDLVVSMKNAGKESSDAMDAAGERMASVAREATESLQRGLDAVAVRQAEFEAAADRRAADQAALAERAVADVTAERNALDAERRAFADEREQAEIERTMAVAIENLDPDEDQVSLFAALIEELTAATDDA